MPKQLDQMSLEELWALFPIILEPYQPKWRAMYEKESARIRAAVPVQRISHIGSTSVPGLLAKPTVDILLEIANKMPLERVIEGMEGLGYLFELQPAKPPPHAMFMKGYTPQGFAPEVFHVHVRYGGDWPELYFCEYLRRHRTK